MPWYHRCRAAEGENAIRDLKYGVGLNHLPSGRFAANGAWLAVQVMAHNLARWAARVGLGQQLVTTKTPRRRFFSLAGRLTRSARRLTLHLPQRWPWETQFNRALARLRAIPRLTDILMAVPQTHPQISPSVSLLAFCLADGAPHRHCGPPSSYLCGCLTPPSSLFYWYLGRTVALPLTLIPRLIGRTASSRWIWAYPESTEGGRRVSVLKR